MPDKYWDISNVLSSAYIATTRDWEYLHDIEDFNKLESSVVTACRDWFGIKEEELFNLHVDLVLAEVFDQTEHGDFSEQDNDLVVLTIGNILTSKLLKSGRNWFKMAYSE